MIIEERAVHTIHPYPGNPRHTAAAVDAVAASIKEFGFRQPIVVDEHGTIIVGHVRYLAALKLALEKVPVHVAVGWSQAKVKAYRLADNKTAELATWNYELLEIELADLQGMNYDLSVIGFDQIELAKLLNSGLKDGLCDPDEIPAPPEQAITQPGDLWLLGDHRLLCGDSAKAADVDVLVNGQPVHFINTDPPYNVRVEPRSNGAIAAGLSSFKASPTPKTNGKRHAQQKQSASSKLRPKDRPLANDSLSDEDFDRLLDAWFSNLARVLLPGHGFLIWGGYSNLGNFPAHLKKNGLYFSQAVVWDKEHPVLGHKDFMGAFELAFYGWKLGAAHRFFGPHNATDLWHVKKISPQQMVHLTEKPTELAERALSYSSLPGENVLDLFGGSGSTLIAAERTGRHALLMEIDPLYCDVIVQRFENFTGTKARRESFTEVNV